MNSDVKKGYYPSLPEELLLNVTPNRCKGCCDDDTQKLISDDSRLSSTTTEDFTKTIIDKASSVGRSIGSALAIPGSVGSRSRSKSRSSPGITTTKSGKEIKQFTTLTIGSLDLGLSGKDCPDQGNIEDEISKQIQPMPDVFFIQNRNKNSKRIFSENNYIELKANKIGEKFVSMYYKTYSAEAVKGQAGIIIYKTPKFNVANIQLNSKSYIKDVIDFLKESTKGSLEEKLKVFNETSEKIKKQQQKIEGLIKSIKNISNDTDTKKQKEEKRAKISDLKKNINEEKETLKKESGLKHDQKTFEYISNNTANIGVIIGNFHDIIDTNKNVINQIAKEVFDSLKNKNKNEVSHLFQIQNISLVKTKSNTQESDILSVKGQPQLTKNAKEYIKKYYEQIKKFFTDNGYVIKSNDFMYKKGILKNRTSRHYY